MAGNLNIDNVLITPDIHHFYKRDAEKLPLSIFHNDILGIGFTFAALTGIFFKEGFCFHRLETKILTPLVPLLLLGHLTGILSTPAEPILLATWAIFFLIFAVRKIIQPIPPDIGDKSVFDYLKNQHLAKV
jgi:uncharacterized integral membrane protein